ncbi:MAG: AmmeMemoRadiSam system protein B [Rhodospirillales bacterium]|jgi:hypothetical protein|nr:AmmeMemoRadiSam system protein B [Rhodospirillales bacterium]MDP6774492.1 AmmeMemoRadiSam system protein B [Rhodospirillales bacterium]
MTFVRKAAVAGSFYPGDARELDATVQYHLSKTSAPQGPSPKAIIAPHAGYIYSGPVAATAYARLAPVAARITRVVLLGPCHRVPVKGLAVSGADAFATPLGNVPLDKEAARSILDLPQVQVFDATHEQEHSLEVHLPFLQVVLKEFALVPLVVGNASHEEVAEVIERLWGGPETLVVISTDLSHYLDYEAARRMDTATCRAIENFSPDAIGRDQACGRIPVKGLLALAKRRRLKIATVDLRNSGDTAGPRDRVVGYGSWLLFEDQAEAPPKDTGESSAGETSAGEDAFGAQTRDLLSRHGASLIKLAALSVEHGLDHAAPLPVKSAEQPPELRANGACFVTLKRDGKLRGCIGSSVAHRPLAADAVVNGFSAAFKDKRFAAVTADELATIDLSISVLGAPAPMAFEDEADLLARLRPGTDGLIIEDSGRRALFLPSVWSGLPEPRTFVAHLKAKAGLKADHWSDAFKAWRFVALEVSSEVLPAATPLWSRRA